MRALRALLLTLVLVSAGTSVGLADGGPARKPARAPRALKKPKPETHRPGLSGRLPPFFGHVQVITPRGAVLVGRLAARLRRNGPDTQGARFASPERALEAIDQAIVKVNTGKGPPPRFDDKRGLRTFELDVNGPLGHVPGHGATRRIRLVVDTKGVPVEATPIPELARPVLSLTAIQEGKEAVRGLSGTAWDVHIAGDGEVQSVNARVQGTVERKGRMVRADVSIHLVDAPPGTTLPPNLRRDFMERIARFVGADGAARAAITDRTAPPGQRRLVVNLRH